MFGFKSIKHVRVKFRMKHYF